MVTKRRRREEPWGCVQLLFLRHAGAPHTACIILWHPCGARKSFETAHSGFLAPAALRHLRLHCAMPLRGCRAAAAASNSRPMSHKRDYRPSHSSPLPLSLPSLFSMFFRRFQGHFSGQIAATASRMRENGHFALLRMYIHGRQNMPQMGRFCAFPIL